MLLVLPPFLLKQYGSVSLWRIAKSLEEYHNEKLNLTVAEAAVYSGIGQNTIREWLKKEDCPFLLWVNDKKLVIRRKEFEDFFAFY